MKLRKCIIFVVFVLHWNFIVTQEGSSSIGKEFDFPAIYHRRQSEIESSPKGNLKSVMKPVMEIKKAMGPLPARLPPIYYSNSFHGYGPYEGDANIIFNNPHKTAGLLMHGPYQQLQSSNLPMANFPTSQMQRRPSVMPNGSPKIDQHLPGSSMVSQYIGGPPMMNGQAPAGTHMMASQRPSGAPMMASRHPSGTPMYSPGHGGTTAAVQHSGGTGAANRHPGGPTMSTPHSPAGSHGAAPARPPDIDYTEENLLLTGGLYLAAIIMKMLGKDVQFQTFLYPIPTGRRKRDSTWTRFAMIDRRMLPTGLNGERQPDTAEKCLEKAACQQPQWAKFYLDNLGKIKSGEKLKEVMDRIRTGISINKNLCNKTFKCLELDLFNKQFEKVLV